MTVEVTFSVNRVGGPPLDEAEIDAALDNVREALRSNEDAGAIHIRAPGQPDVAIEDELWALVLNLCFRPVPDLIAGREAIVPYFAQSGEIQLVPDGDAIRLSGDDQPEAHYDATEFLRALHACGRRYITYRRHLWEDDPDSEAVLAYLEPAAEEAGRALGVTP